MSTLFVDTNQTRFRMLVDKGEGEGEEKQIALVLAADPPNTIYHYDALKERFHEQYPHGTFIAFELPGFASSKTSCNTVKEFADTLAEFLQKLREDLCRNKCMGLVLPCVAGLFAPLIAENLDKDVVDFFAVPQCGDYNCEKNWADGINVGGMLSLSFVSRILNYVRASAIAKGWYKATFPARGKYDEVVQGQVETREACLHMRKAFSDKTMQNFSQGGTFPLAFFLQRMFFAPLASDNTLIDKLRNPDKFNAKISVPTLALWGLQDGSHKGATDKSYQDSFASYVKSDCFHVETIPGSAHFPELQCPKTFLQTIDNFLKKHHLIGPNSSAL